MKTTPPRALIFDLGGVLIDFDFTRAFQAWQPISALSLDEIKSTFRFDTMYEQHERGEIAAADYFAHLCATLKLEEDFERVEAGWNAIFTGEIIDTRMMVQAARSQIPCYAFTNTNHTHQQQWMSMFPAVAESFDRVFASHQMGYRKPERRAFEYIAQAIGVPLGEMLFFDDLQENIEGAAAAGLGTVHVRSPADVRAALLSLGCA